VPLRDRGRGTEITAREKAAAPAGDTVIQHQCLAGCTNRIGRHFRWLDEGARLRRGCAGFQGKNRSERAGPCLRPRNFIGRKPFLPRRLPELTGSLLTRFGAAVDFEPAVRVVQLVCEMPQLRARYGQIFYPFFRGALPQANPERNTGEQGENAMREKPLPNNRLAALEQGDSIRPAMWSKLKPRRQFHLGRHRIILSPRASAAVGDSSGGLHECNTAG